MTSCKKESDHTEFHLYIDRKRTGIHTKIGHGETEIHEYLIRSMARELRLNKEQFLGLVDCSIDGDQYTLILKENGDIPHT